MQADLADQSVRGCYVWIAHIGVFTAASKALTRGFV
jgi:hypothetical protein